MKPFIVFEGIDNSGKTTVSRKLLERYPSENVVWSKEPIFSTEEADRLNSPECTDEGAREWMFMRSRIRQQEVYNNTICLLDRYLWTGMAYAKAFSPSILGMCIEAYQDYSIFRKPDLTFFMETPLETCLSREPSVGICRLRNIREAYRDTEQYVNTPIVYIDGTMSVDECVEFCAAELHSRFPEVF